MLSGSLLIDRTGVNVLNKKIKKGAPLKKQKQQQQQLIYYTFVGKNNFDNSLT